jgi:protein-disulfide isomerase
VSDLRTAAVPVLRSDDHLRGPAEGPLVIVYADFECPFCAVVHAQLASRSLRIAFRHFPVRARHRRAWPAACAAEAAGLQGHFWEMHDLLLADQGRLEDPHLWDRAQALGIDVHEFDAQRRSDAVRARVQRDFESGVRAGVVSTPTLFTPIGTYAGRVDEAVLDALAHGEADEAPATMRYVRNETEKRSTPPTEGRSKKGN